jgi:hypothetical protein
MWAATNTGLWKSSGEYAFGFSASAIVPWSFAAGVSLPSLTRWSGHVVTLSPATTLIFGASLNCARAPLSQRETAALYCAIAASRGSFGSWCHDTRSADPIASRMVPKPRDALVAPHTIHSFRPHRSVRVNCSRIARLLETK